MKNHLNISDLFSFYEPSFVSLSWKFDNPYYHNTKKTCLHVENYEHPCALNLELHIENQEGSSKGESINLKI